MAKKIDFGSIENIYQSEDKTPEVAGTNGLETEEMPKEETNRDKIRVVDIDDIIPNPNNMFSMKRDEEYKELLVSVKVNGQTNNIEVKPKDENGKYMILSGERRWNAFKENGLKKVRVTIKGNITNLREEKTEIMRTNLATRAKKPFDLAASIKSIAMELPEEESLEKYFVGPDSILGLGMTRTTFFRIYKLCKLPDYLFSLGKEELLSANLATKLLTNVVYNDGAINYEKLAQIEEDIKKRLNSEQTDTEKELIIRDIIKRFTKKGGRKPNATNKNLTAYRFTQNMNALCKRVKMGDYELPKMESKKQKLVVEIDDTIEILNDIKRKLQEQE